MHSYAKVFFLICFIFTLIFFPWEVVFVSVEDHAESSNILFNDHLKDQQTVQEENNLEDHQNDQKTEIQRNPEVKYILLYETPPWMKTVKLLPSAKKCIVTSDRKLLPKIEMFDALLFSGQHPWSVEKSFPKYRSSEQFYVFVDLECPPMSAHKFASDPNRELYNLTMTYRRDSDIYWPYGFIAKDNVKYLSEAEEPEWMEPVFDDAEEIDPTLLQSIETKHKTAAWFVSNCHAQSNRNELAHAMQKTIDVDIYGKCGPLVCPRSKTGECYDHVEQEYFFYLSFENNLCNDYITEKVFSIMRYNIVPVVYGGANYSQHLPPHSYIDANDFTTATDLANYLNYLRENIKEYVKFFWWKKYYKTIFSGKVYNNICDKLHELTSSGNERNATFYEDIETWWTKDQCSKKKQKIKFI